MIDFKGRKIPETLEEIIDPKHTALVIHDMQNDPCNPESPPSKMIGHFHCDRIMGNLLKIREAARKAGVLVMYTQYTNQPDWQSVGDYWIYKNPDRVGTDRETKPLTNVMGTWGWQIVEELKPAPNEVSILKYRTNTFIGTNFDNILRTNHIKTIVSTGIALEVGIDPTARTATLLDYFVVVPKDCVSGRIQEWMDETMKWMERSILVPTTDEVIRVWNKRSA